MTPTQALALGLATCALLVVDVWRASRTDPQTPSRARAHGLVFLLTELPRYWTLPLRVGAFALAAEASPLRLDGVSPPLVFAVAFIGVDLLLYVWHRVLHETVLGRAFHDVHHSSRAYDLSVGARVSPVQRLVDDLIYLPIALLGVPASVLVTAITVNRAFQFWTHTEAVPRLRWLDPWLNTPANHRVHHRSAGDGPARNYGSALMIWDRAFGTYVRERDDDPRSFAIGGYTESTSPFDIAFAPLVRWWRERRERDAPDPTPVSVRIGFTLWVVVAAVVSALREGPLVLLWLCVVANALLVLSFFSGRRLWSSVALVATGPVWAVYWSDLAAHGAGHQAFGWTDYMFDPAIPLVVRALSLFHIAAPILALHRVAKLGVDPRAGLVAWAMLVVLISLSAWASHSAAASGASLGARITDINGALRLGGSIPRAFGEAWLTLIIIATFTVPAWHRLVTGIADTLSTLTSPVRSETLPR